VGDFETQTGAATNDRCAARFSRLLDDYVAGRLDPEAETALGAHLLVCDRCFTEFITRTLVSI